MAFFTTSSALRFSSWAHSHFPPSPCLILPFFLKPAPPPSSYLDQVDARGLRGFRQRLIGRRDRQLVTDSQVEVGGGYTDRQAFQKGIRFLCRDAPFPNRQFSYVDHFVEP